MHTRSSPPPEIVAGIQKYYSCGYLWILNRKQKNMKRSQGWKSRSNQYYKNYMVNAIVIFTIMHAGGTDGIIWNRHTEGIASHIEGCFTRSDVPGKKILKSIGLVQYTKKGIAGDVPNEIDGIFQALVDTARKKEANAVVNVRITTGSYQQQGSQWEVTYIIAYGEAVVLE